jgi:predicted phage baseplate assembly protein
MQHDKKVIFLDNEYNLPPDSWVVIQKPRQDNAIAPALIIEKLSTEKVCSRSIAAYGLSGKSTRINLDTAWLSSDDLAAATESSNDSGTPAGFSIVRGTTVYAQSEELVLTEAPITEAIGSTSKQANRIELDGLYDGLESGRWVIVSGERSDLPGVKSSELVMLAAVEQTSNQDFPGDSPHTTLIFAEALAYAYKRDTVTIYGNVVKATHGETRAEVLGSGAGGKSFQQFPLRQLPLTYLAAPTAIGSASTLELRVNEVRWYETDSFVGLGPNDRNYILRTDDHAQTTVVFGNGRMGSRLPTGIENIRAVYRSGIGKAGNVKAAQISVLATRPLGLKGVTNPLPATGGADRESRDTARRNIPLAVMALDRLVSTQDYADFARTFAGIGKTSAKELSNGRQQVVHVTIAGADDIPIDRNSDLYRNLLQALQQNSGDPYQPIQLVLREMMVLILVARIRVLPDYLWEFVEPKIRATLLSNFSFEQRELGQSIPLSEVTSVIQKIPGVDFVDVDIFDSISETQARSFVSSSTEKSSLVQPLTEKLKDIAKSKYRDSDPLTENSGNEFRQPRPHVSVALARIEAGKSILPAQLAIFSPAIADTMILKEWTA